MGNAAKAFAQVLRWAQTEDDVERIMQLATVASLREDWHQIENQEVADAGRDRIRALRGIAAERI